jgi:hypothetical protein
MLKELSRIYIKEVFLRHKVLTKIISNRDIKVLKNLYSRIRNLNSYINSILSIDRQINRKTKLDTKTVFKALC